MSTEPIDHRGYLDRHGEALIDNGYTVVPIQVGKKAPGFDGWQKAKASKLQVREWVEHGHRNAGVGILTKLTPAVDIDVQDEDIALQMEAFVLREIDQAPVRIGKPPKRLLLFRCDEPFRKVRSTVYVDEWEQKCLIEVLGDGQQFVAFHTHPDTKRPYIWTGKSPLQVRAGDLPTLTVEQVSRIIEKFEELAKAACVDRGWRVYKKAREQPKALDKDNPWAEDTAPVQIEDDELRSRLLLVPGAEDYDTWVQVGMALYHQFDGDQVGLDLWHEWSEVADNYDPDALARHWESFSISGKKRAPITARYILRLAKEAVETTSVEMALKLRDAFLSATNIVEWKRAVEMAREAEIDGIARGSIAQVAKDAIDKIMGTKTPLVEVKKTIAYSPKGGEKTPKWAARWVYDTSDDRFFHLDTKIAVTQQGFNAMHDRHAMTRKDALDGKSGPSSTASGLALNLYRITAVNGRRYMPGRDPIFHEPDGVFANSYPEHEIPELPDQLLPRDKRNVERVKRHIAHLLADPWEQRMLLDWLSWVVQNPGRHANYAVLLQGVEGDGKSFFGAMMRAVMGVSNVRMLNAKILESDFTDWAVGQCLTCFEEVRLVKHNKWEVINTIKPFITNTTIEVHPKGKATYNATNTTNYLLFTNYRDALPLDDDGRRYLVLFSRWQRKEKLDAFKAEHPRYYEELYRTFEESAPALRKWLLEHEQHDDFRPFGDAPTTESREFMIRQAKPELIQLIDDAIAEDQYVGISKGLLDLGEVRDLLLLHGLEMPSPKAISAMLTRAGWESLGQVRFGDRRLSVYSKVPENFIRSGKVAAHLVANFLKKRQDGMEL